MNPFKKPFRRFETPRESIITILVFGLFIFLFLFIFKPFGLTQLETRLQFFVTLGFGFVTTFMLFILKFLLEPIVIRSNWTLGKSVLWDILIASAIGVANYVYISVIFPHIFVFKYIFVSMWTAILVGIIPVSISYIIAFNKMYRLALKDAAIPPDKVLWEKEVIIRAGNPKNEFKTNPKSIVYLCSNDNYVTIVTLKGETLTKTHLRGTLKAAESELRKNSSFFRCHKCFIINAEYADRMTGNIQNLKIKLKINNTEIPVSRSKASEAIRKFR